MRLIFFTRRLTVGGAQINAINLGRALIARGHQIWFFADEGPLVSRVVSAGMRFVHVPYSDKHPSVSTVRKLVAAVKTHGIDLIQAFDSIPILEAYGASVWVGKPAYGIASMQAMPEHRLPKSRELALVNAETRERYIREHGWSPEKLRLIVARLDCDYYRPADSDTGVLTRHGVRPDRGVVTLITRVDEDKWPTIELFISVAERWAESPAKDTSPSFVVVGGGPLLDALKARVAESTSEPVVVAGELMDIPAVMNESDLVLGMASTCQQGMACGRPVITVGREGYSGIVDQDNFDALAECHFNPHSWTLGEQPETLCGQIEDVLSSRDRATELGEFGRKMALERYDSRIGARQLEEVYERLILSGGRSLTGWGAEFGDLVLSLGSLYRHRGKRRVKRIVGRLWSPSPG